MQQFVKQRRFVGRAIAGGFFFKQAQRVDEVLGLIQADSTLPVIGLGTWPRATMACVASVVNKNVSEAGGSGTSAGSAIFASCSLAPADDSAAVGGGGRWPMVLPRGFFLGFDLGLPVFVNEDFWFSGVSVMDRELRIASDAAESMIEERFYVSVVADHWPVACFSTAAPMKPANSGCASVGLLLNSGWNCTATNHGCSGNSIDFHQRMIGARAGDQHAVGFELLAIGIVELVAMAMAFEMVRAAVALLRFARRIEPRFLRRPAASCRLYR